SGRREAGVFLRQIRRENYPERPRNLMRSIRAPVGSPVTKSQLICSGRVNWGEIRPDANNDSTADVLPTSPRLFSSKINGVPNKGEGAPGLSSMLWAKTERDNATLAHLN